METYMGYPGDPAMGFPERMEKMYPEAYSRMYPHVRHLVGALDDGALTGLESADVDRLAEEAMRRSGVAGDPPAGHNAHTLNDMARGMVLRDMRDRFRGRRFFPYLPPFLFFPYPGDGYGDGYYNYGYGRHFEPRHGHERF